MFDVPLLPNPAIYNNRLQITGVKFPNIERARTRAIYMGGIYVKSLNC